MILGCEVPGSRGSKARVNINLEARVSYLESVIKLEV